MFRSLCAALLGWTLASGAVGAAEVPASSPAPASASLPAAAANAPTFAGMAWGASHAQVLAAAAASGLQVVARHGDDLELTGAPFGAEAVVHALISPTAGLVKVQVQFASGETPARTYATVIERLTRLYGPTEPVELFKRPFVRGDGREDEALRTGKGLLIAAWGDERQPGQAAVILHAGRPGVELEFESHAWKAESVRRQHETSSSGPALASLGAAPAARRASTGASVGS